jgi:hypothetical protein
VKKKNSLIVSAIFAFIVMGFFSQIISSEFDRARRKITPSKSIPENRHLGVTLPEIPPEGGRNRDLKPEAKK